MDLNGWVWCFFLTAQGPGFGVLDTFIYQTMNFLGTGPSRDVQKKMPGTLGPAKGGCILTSISWLLQFTTPWNKEFKFEVLLGGSNLVAITKVSNHVDFFFMYDFP